jgi:hypothetical protein
MAAVRYATVVKRSETSFNLSFACVIQLLVPPIETTKPVNDSAKMPVALLTRFCTMALNIFSTFITVYPCTLKCSSIHML